jgi:hypothetical protein
METNNNIMCTVTNNEFGKWKWNLKGSAFPTHVLMTAVMPFLNSYMMYMEAQTQNLVISQSAAVLGI